MDFLKSCEDLYTVCRIPLTIVTAAGEPLLGLPGPHDELIPRRAVHWVLTDFLLQKRDTLHRGISLVWLLCRRNSSVLWGWSAHSRTRAGRSYNLPLRPLTHSICRHSAI